MSDFRIDKITNRTGDTGPQICGVSTFSGTSGMAMPGGPTEYRGGRGRGILGPGSQIPSGTFTNLNYIDIATTGNAQEFGDLSYGNAYRGGFASSTRGVWVNGQNDQTTDYTIISSKGGGSDFGEILNEPMGGATFNSSTIGFRAGGSDGGVHTDQIIGMRIAQVASFYDFGDLLGAGTYMNGASSPTRGVIFGEATPSSPVTNNTIQYVTMTSQGNAKDFGDLITARKYADTASNTTRALAAGGNATPAANTNSIEYVTIATTGNAADFGDLTSATALGKSGSVSTATRGIFAGFHPAKINGMDYVTIMTTGNSVDFGDMTVAMAYVGGCSDSNGGLG